MSRRFVFTKTSIDNLPAHDRNSPSREAEYADAECTGLHLRVSKGGRKFFQHRYRFLGRKKCITIGEFPHISVQIARRTVGEHRALLSKDIDPADERTQRRNDLTLTEYARREYLPHAKAHKKTWEEDAWKIEKRIIPAMGHLRLSTISARDVTAYHSAEKSRTSAITANHHLRLLKRMLNLAVKWGFIERNPAAGMENFREPPHRERYLSREELPRFLSAMETQRDRLSVAALKLLLFTGCRRNEILSLKWSQIRFAENRILLIQTKNGRSRSVMLNNRALDVLHELLSIREEGQEHLFPAKPGAKEPYRRGIRKTFYAVCKEAGIEGLRIHDLRHSFATLAIQGGASLFDVQKLLGHQDIAMTQRYAHMVDEGLQRATDNMALVIDQAISA